MKKSSAKKIFLWSIFILIMWMVSAFADTIKLKNGREIFGRIKEITDKDVVLELGGGKTWFGIEQVESINSLSVEEARAKLGTKDALMFGKGKDALASSAKEGINFVAKTRKLEFKNIPEIEITSTEKVKAHLKEQTDKLYNRKKLETRGKLLVKLGIIADAQDYADKAIEVMSGQIAGYYNPDDKKIYIVENVLGEVRPGLPSMTIMHEQIHALQDQYYNLKNLTNLLTLENEDRALAIQSVIEGEATVLMYDAYFRSFKGFGMDTGSSGFDLRSFIIDSMMSYGKHFKTKEGKAAIFMEDLLFPYFWGGNFIQYTVNNKGWEAVDAIYTNLPNSSEQIMHPEKYYLNREEPKIVILPDLSAVLGTSWLRLSKDTLGEFGFYLIGKVFLDELQCKVMSEGWGGDYFEFYEEQDTKKTLLVSLSKWDSEKEAEDFFSFYKKAIEKKYKELKLIKEDKDASHWKAGEDNVYLARNKESVLIIEGAPDSIFSGLLALIKI